MKHELDVIGMDCDVQPPLGGCELKLPGFTIAPPPYMQPPLGGCELKPQLVQGFDDGAGAAAFGRL